MSYSSLVEVTASSAPFPSRDPQQLRILTLDGGGIRGLATLFVLQDLMIRIQVRNHLDKPPRPCEWFDLMVGTSTGGLIALLLGRLRMSVDDAIEAYKSLSKEVFDTSTRAWLQRFNLVAAAPTYLGEKLEAALRKIAGDERLADLQPSPTCRVAVVAVQQLAANRNPDLLRTYTTDVLPYGCSIVDAARATFAATAFFPPAIVQIRPGLDIKYLNGSLGYNNPTDLAVREAEDIWGPDRRIGHIISIGTGTPQYVRFEGNKGALAGKLLDILTDCQAVHLSMESRFGGMQKRMYFRFNPPNDLARISLDEWEKLDDVCNLVYAYLREDQVKCRDCVAALTHPDIMWDSVDLAFPLFRAAGSMQTIQDVVGLRTAVQEINQQDLKTTRKTIPLLPGPLFGREDEVNDVVQVLLNNPDVGVAILGTGGIGKSAVAIAVLHHRRMEEAFGAFRFFIRCDSGIENGGEARASGTSGPDPTSQFKSLIATQIPLDVAHGDVDDILQIFSRQPAVLVLDNLETLWDRSGPELDELFQFLFTLQKLRLVVTMRGTVTPWGTWHEKLLDTLDIESARKVFIDRSGKANFLCDPFMDKVLGAVERLPLGVVLLARQARTQPNLQSLWKEWERCHTAMVLDDRYREGAATGRLLSLDASIQLSLDRPLMASNPSALTLLSLLSLLPDGASWQDLEALVPSSSLSREHGRPEKVLLQLSLAYIKSSVAGQRSTTDTSPQKLSGHPDNRLQVLNPIRQYVQRKYVLGKTDYERLGTHYLNIVITQLSRPQVCGSWPDIHNLEAITIRTLSVESEDELALHAAQVLCDFSEMNGMDFPALTQTLGAIPPIRREAELTGIVEDTLGRMALLRCDYHKAMAMLHAALPLHEHLDNILGKARCIRSIGEACLGQSKYEEAKERLEEALANYTHFTGRLGNAECDRLLGLLSSSQQEDKQGRERIEEALVLYQEVSNTRGKARCIRSLGEVYLGQLKYEEARQKLEEALETYRHLNDRLGKAYCIRKLGCVALEQSKYGEAREKLDEALALYQDLHNRRGMARCISCLGVVALTQWKFDEATERLQKALALNKDLGDTRGIAHCILSLAVVAVNQSKNEKATSRFAKALSLYEDVSDRRGEAQCIHNLGLVALNRSKYVEARARFTKALPLYGKVGDRRGEAQCTYNLGLIALRQSEYAQAREALREALAIFEDLPDRVGTAQCLHTLGLIALDQSNKDEARAKLTEALSLYEGVSRRTAKAECIHNLGLIAFRQSDYEEARRRFVEAMAIYESVPDRLAWEHCLHNLGLLA